MKDEDKEDEIVMGGEVILLSTKGAAQGLEENKLKN